MGLVSLDFGLELGILSLEFGFTKQLDPYSEMNISGFSIFTFTATACTPSLWEPSERLLPCLILNGFLPNTRSAFLMSVYAICRVLSLMFLALSCI